MKNLNFLVIGLFLSLISLLGCEKDVEKPDVPTEPTKPTILISLNPQTVYYGDSCLVIYSASNNTKKVLFDGQVIPNSGSFVLRNLIKDTSIMFVLVNETGEFPEIRNIVLKYKVPTITLTANPDTLPIGGGTTIISWTTQNADSVLINGVWYEPNGSVETEHIVTTCEFSALAKGKGGEISKTKTIMVLLPLTMEELLCDGPWYLVKLEFMTPPSTEWVEADIFECDLDNFLIFYSNYIAVHNSGPIKCNENEPQTDSGPWSMNENGTMVTLGQLNFYFIEVLDETTLRWTNFSGGTNKQVRCTFAHQPLQ